MDSLSLEDFTFICGSDGDCYVEGSVPFTEQTFILEDNGDLYFDDTLMWLDDYFVIQNSGYYKWWEDINV